MINVLYQFNEKYAPYAGVSMTSLIINNRYENIVFYILGEDLSNSTVVALTNICKEAGAEIVLINTIELVSMMKKFNMPTYRNSYAANMRLFLPMVLDETVDRVLYLDADTIIDGDISELYFSDLEENIIGMVYDSVGQSHKADIDFAENDEYFNSGVVLFDLNKWREEGITERIINHVTNVRSQYAAPDQDLLNIICKKRIMKLDLKFNFQPVHGEFSVKQYLKNYKPVVYYSADEIEQKPVIYHCYRFLGEFPWDDGNLHPFTYIFDEYMHQSAFKDYVKEKKKNPLAIQIEKGLFIILPHGVFLPIFALCHRLFIWRASKDSERNKINKIM